MTVEAVEGDEEAGDVTIKTENNVEHEAVLRQQHQQQQQQPQLETAGYASSVDEGGDGVGVLEAGRPEMENGVLVEPSVAEAVAITVGADHEGDPNAAYTLHELGYTTHHIIHDRYVILQSITFHRTDKKIHPLCCLQLKIIYNKFSP